jgi:hypothetical protein
MPAEIEQQQQPGLNDELGSTSSTRASSELMVNWRLSQGDDHTSFFDTDFPWHQGVLGDRMRGEPRGTSCSLLESLTGQLAARPVAAPRSCFDTDFPWHQEVLGGRILHGMRAEPGVSASRS